MRFRSSISTECPSPETATSTPQPECIRNPRAARFMLQAPQFFRDKGTNPGLNSFHCDRRCNIRERESQRNVRIFPPVHFHVRIDKVVQWFTVLRRAEAQVTAHAELYPVRVVRSEEVVALLRVLPGFGDLEAVWNALRSRHSDE